MGLRVSATFIIFMICLSMALPPIYSCGYCKPPPQYRPIPPRTGPPRTSPPRTSHPPGGHPKVSPPHHKPPRPPVIGPPVIYPPPVVNPPIVFPPPVVNPPIVFPPPVVIPPPVILPPPSPTYPPYTGPPGGGGGGGSPPFVSPPTTYPTCPINALKLGACVDVLGGLIHIGLGDPVENVCCPVLGGLLELEAAVCLCTTLRIKLLNLNIFIPLALQALITCGKTPPPGFICPPLT